MGEKGREVGEKGEGSGGKGGGKWGERGRELGMGYPPVHPLILGVVGVKGLFSHFLQFLGTAKLEVFQYYFIERRPEMALESRYYTRPQIQ